MNKSVGNKDNIILIGFMGCGKTTIGTELAKQLSYSFVDSDDQIEELTGLRIVEIFHTYGEEYFRKLEMKVIESISKKQQQIIATGGGVVKNPINVQQLRTNGFLVYLEANAEHIYNNLKEDQSRPLLQGNNKLQKIQVLLEERKELYESSADWSIPISYRTVDEIVQHILNKVGDNT